MITPSLRRVQADDDGGASRVSSLLKSMAFLTPAGFQQPPVLQPGAFHLWELANQTLLMSDSKINSKVIFQFVGLLYKGFCDPTENSILFSVFIFLGQGSYKIEWSVKGLLMVSKFA